MFKLQIYKYYDNPDELLKPNIEYKFGGTSIGKFNNKEIIVSPGKYEKELEWDDAIKYCKKLNRGGYKDWYLPNKDELNFMYENKDKLHKFDKFANLYYWSCTESNGTDAWGQYFGDGNQSSGDKNYRYYVRAIRSQ